MQLKKSWSIIGAIVSFCLGFFLGIVGFQKHLKKQEEKIGGKHGKRK